MYRAADIRLPGSLPDVPDWREMMIKYCAAVTHADMLSGQGMDVLDTSGQRENPLVLFMGDHGASIPFGKGRLYPMGWNVPRLVRWPSRVEAGAVSDELTAGLDLFAPFFEAGGARVPPGTESRRVPGLLAARAHQGREYVCPPRPPRNDGAARLLDDRLPGWGAVAAQRQGLGTGCFESKEVVRSL